MEIPNFVSFIGKGHQLEIECPQDMLQSGLVVEIRFPPLDLANPRPFYEIFREKYWHQIDDRYFACLLCLRKLSMDSLYSHMNLHLGILPYNCEFCSVMRRFSSSHSLQKHIRSDHQGEKQKKVAVSIVDHRPANIIRLNCNDLLKKRDGD